MESNRLPAITIQFQRCVLELLLIGIEKFQRGCLGNKATPAFMKSFENGRLVKNGTHKSKLLRK